MRWERADRKGLAPAALFAPSELYEKTLAFEGKQVFFVMARTVIFKFGFVGELPRPLPSPAEKGDREAVDEESICNPTYRDYS